jgi:hypothetical protein
MDKHDIFGRWDILAWEQLYDDGRRVLPMGEHLEGFIEYGEHGMFCVIARPQRARFASGAQWNASPDEKAAAYSSYLTYAGGYWIEGETIVHEVVHSLFPNWEGGLQRRSAVLEGATLHLSARLEENTPEARTARLSWRRHC